MKKVIVLQIVITLAVSAAMGQNQQTKTNTKPQTNTVQGQTKPKETPKNPLAEHFLNKYSLASRWNDLDVAKDAMYDLIVQYPGSDSLIFALAYFYFENEKFASSAIICQDLLTRTPKNAQVLELGGASFESLGIYDRALQNYESLFLLTNNNSTLYKISFLQYQAKRYKECLTSIDILLTKPEADSTKVSFNDEQKKPKEYIMRVALLNLKGMAYKEESDLVNAKKYFEEALAIAPDFVLAKENLAKLK